MASPTFSRDALQAYIRSQHEKPYLLSEIDCATYVADWVSLKLRHDIFTALRATYACENKKAKLLSGKNIVSLMQDLAGKNKIEETAEPVRGDVGAFIANECLAVGIYTGNAWSGRNERGIFIVKNFKTLKAFKI